jgi:hypothetical protein
MNKIDKIIALNNNLKKQLDIKKIKSYHYNDMIFKICYTVLERYKSNFQINPKQVDLSLMKKYINDLIVFIDKYLIKTEEITKQELLSFHFNVLKPLTTTEKIPHHLI